MRKIPPEIERIFDKPGGEWTGAERHRIIEWLFEPQQRGFLLFKGLRYLGTPQNAEDAWGDFCTRRLDQVKTPLDQVIKKYDQVKTPLNRVIEKYDPAKGYRFWNYLLSQFRYFCLDEWKKVRRQTQTQQELVIVIGKDEEGEPIEIELVDDKDLTPPEIAEYRALVKALKDCVNNLTSARKDAVVHFYFKELSIKETAEKLEIRVGAVRVNLHRAKPNLKECLKGKGWLS